MRSTPAFAHLVFALGAVAALAGTSCGSDDPAACDCPQGAGGATGTAATAAGSGGDGGSGAPSTATTSATSGAATTTGVTSTTAATTTAGSGGAPGCEEPPRMLRLMTYNVKHGAESGLQEVAAVIHGEDADLIALQELDVDADRSGDVDQPHRLGQLTARGNLFRTAVVFDDGGRYGVGLLSRFPIVTSQSLLLPSTGEQRILATVDVEIEPGRLLRVGVTHMGLDAAERLDQAEAIVDAIGGDPLAILMGDLNEQPDGAAIATLLGPLRDAWPLAGEGDGFTIPPDAPARRIDYVLLGSGWDAPTSAQVLDTLASDHLPLVVEVPWPR